MVAAAAVAAGGSIYAANKTASSQRKATDAAAQQAEKQAAADKAANDRLLNRANQKTANFGDFTSMNAMQNMGGVGSTMLTGPGGANPNSTMLGYSTLLGS